LCSVEDNPKELKFLVILSRDTMGFLVYDIAKNTIFKVDLSTNVLASKLGEVDLNYNAFFRNIVYHKGKVYALLSEYRFKKQEGEYSRRCLIEIDINLES
jgi:hypothetical protein